MLHAGEIAFDGQFDELRRLASPRQILRLETATSRAPMLPGASLLGSTDGRHEYEFDPAATPLLELLNHAAALTEISHVETRRAPIDQVVAELYERWQSTRGR